MRVGMLEEAGRVIVKDADTPVAGRGELLIRVAYAGVCGSDLHSFLGTHPFRKPPVVLGHEVSGTVAAVGEGATGFALGDRVTVMPYLACGECLYCRRGRSNICENKTVPGIKGWLGSFAGYFVSRPEITYRLGGRTTLKQGALAEPLAVAVHSAVRGRVGPGSRVLVLGGGTIGLLTAYAARRMGADFVALTDLYDHNLGVARHIGVARTYNARMEGLEGAVRGDCPEGFDVLFLTGGAPVTVGQATRLAQRGARIVSTAIFPGDVPLDIVSLTLYELELVGTQIYVGADFGRAVEWLDEDGELLETLIDHVMPLEAAHEALAMLAERRVDAIKVLLQPTDG